MVCRGIFRARLQVRARHGRSPGGTLYRRQDRAADGVSTNRAPLHGNAAAFGDDGRTPRFLIIEELFKDRQFDREIERLGGEVLGGGDAGQSKSVKRESGLPRGSDNGTEDPPKVVIPIRLGPLQVADTITRAKGKIPR